jgi:hypothetical protein
MSIYLETIDHLLLIIFDHPQKSKKDRKLRSPKITLLALNLVEA